MSFLFDLDFDPMTLILKLDLDVIKMYLYFKNKLPSYSISNIMAQTDRHTHIQVRLKLLPSVDRIISYITLR